MYIAVVIGIVVVAIFLFLGFYGVGNSTQQAPQSEAQSDAQTLLNEIAKNGSVTSLQVIDR